MKKPYQIGAGRAIQRVREWAEEKNPAVQLMLPMIEILALAQHEYRPASFSDKYWAAFSMFRILCFGLFLPFQRNGSSVIILSRANILESGAPLSFGRERKKETLDEFFRTVPNLIRHLLGALTIHAPQRRYVFA